MDRAVHPGDEQTVPDELIGCWRRAWIEFADRSVDDTTVVIWLQLASEMADIRVPGERPLRARSGFDACSLDELRSLADSESSSGYTVCSPVVVGDDGVRRATAEWLTGDRGTAFQPVSAFPEPGLLEWRSDDVMIERAPSGAYVEEWHRLPGTGTGTGSCEVTADGRQLYRIGDVAVLVRPRAVPPLRVARLDELVADCDDDRDRIVALVDCEYSFARRQGGVVVIEASTLPWREGEVLDVGLR